MRSTALVRAWPLAMGLVAALGAAPAPPTWTEVRSPHFVVVCDAGASPARRVAAQLERIRLVFQSVFPTLQADPAMPIEVIAVRNRAEFQALEPSAYQGPGQLQLAGYFQRTPESNLIAMRLDINNDAGDEVNPYAAIYHEYTHVLTAKAAATLPLWLDEGLAEYFQNTTIAGDQALIGEPDQANLAVLRHQPWLPLAELFAINYNSPYYHESDRGTIFYAESWLLVHYFMTEQAQLHRPILAPYLALLAQNVNAFAAARQAFGDLEQLQEALVRYVQQPRMLDFRVKLAAKVSERAYAAEPLPPGQGDAYRADFLAHVGRLADASALLREVLRQDSQNLSAIETMGYIAEAQGHLDQALDWYARAVGLNARDYLAQYLYAAITLQAAGALDAPTAARVEAALHTAIQLNPDFAPARDSLAVAEGERHEDLDDARQQELEAIALDPSRIGYRLNLASILVQMHQLAAAAAALRQALPLAASPAQAALCASRLAQIQSLQAEENPK